VLFFALGFVVVFRSGVTGITMNEIEEIKQKLNVVDFVGEYVRLARAGSGYKGLCPFHNEKTPSFTVSEERQMFHCFGCQKGGDVFTFLMEMEGLEFREALEVLAERTGVDLKERGYGQRRPNNDNQIHTKKILEIMELSMKFFEKQLWEGQGAKTALPYLTDRNIQEAMLRYFRIGFAPEGWDNIGKFLLSRGYSHEEIVATGLIVQKTPESTSEDQELQEKSSRAQRSYDRFRERIMFPIMDPLGRVIGYSARVLPGTDEKGGKYINTPETAIYHKSRAIYGLSQAKESIKREGSVILVEGNMDVIAMHQVGFENAVAASGTALTEEHIRILKRYAQEILFFFDMDEAGQTAARKSVILTSQLDVPAKIIVLHEGKDAAEMAAENVGVLREAVASARPAMEHFLDTWAEEVDLSEVGGKRIFADRALEMMASMVNEVEISHWMSRVADHIDMEVDRLYDMLRQRRQKEQRFADRAQSHQESSRNGIDEKENQPTDRVRTLEESVAVWCLVYPKTWKKCVENGVVESVDVISSRLFSSVLERGVESEYSYEVFRSLVEEDVRVRAEHVYQRFIVEIEAVGKKTESDAMEEVERLLTERNKELTRKKIRETSRAIKEAEGRGDREEVDVLSRSLTELMRKQ